MLPPASRYTGWSVFPFQEKKNYPKEILFRKYYIIMHQENIKTLSTLTTRYFMLSTIHWKGLSFFYLFFLFQFSPSWFSLLVGWILLKSMMAFISPTNFLVFGMLMEWVMFIQWWTSTKFKGKTVVRRWLVEWLLYFVFDWGRQKGQRTDLQACNLKVFDLKYL